MTQKNERLPHAQAKIYPDLVHYWSRDGWSGVSYQSEQADDRAVRAVGRSGVECNHPSLYEACSFGPSARFASGRYVHSQRAVGKLESKGSAKPASDKCSFRCETNQSAYTDGR
jgi:hypothetical protein